MAIKLIIGLGNPGQKYERTRHNIGFEVVEMLAAKWDSVPKDKFNSRVASSSGGRPALAMPQTYMNNSGQAVRAIIDFYKFAPDEIMVISDDFTIALGALRLRKTGSDGGHNGLASIIEHLGTSSFPRLRMGIGAPPAGMDPADFVLSRFTKEESKDMERAKLEAVDLIENILEQGWEKAVSKLPSKDGKPKK